MGRWRRRGLRGERGEQQNDLGAANNKLHARTQVYTRVQQRLVRPAETCLVYIHDVVMAVSRVLLASIAPGYKVHEVHTRRSSMIMKPTVIVGDGG